MNTLSVVVVSYNARDYLERCLRSLYNNPPPFSMNVIVVDNASSDDSVEMARKLFPDTCLAANTINRGFGPAMNQGIKMGQSEFVFLLNSDTEIFPGTLSTLIDVLRRQPKAGAIAPLFVNGNGDIIQMSWGWNPLFFGEILQKFFAPRNLKRSGFRRAIVKRLQAQERTAPILCGAAMLFRRQTLEDIGFFDEDYVMYLEDSDLCTRSWKKGWECVFTPAARIVHHLGKSSADPTGRLALLYRQSQILYYRKHGSPLERFLLSIYLRLKFWRVNCPEVFPSAKDRLFYETLRNILTGKADITLQQTSHH